MRLLSILATLCLGALVTQSALARERLVLDMNDAQFRGGDTIMLKREIKRQYPRLRVRDLDLVRVRLVAKTRQGRGQATLRVGNWRSRPERVNGHPRDFRNPAPYTFDRVNFPYWQSDSRGAWQIELRGNFVVRRVVVVVEDQFRRPPRQPEPPRRPQPPRGRTEIITCQSWGDAYMSCPASGRIVSAQVIDQLSSDSCRQGRSYGFSGDTLWVNHGCRARFSVTVRGRR